MSLKDDDLAQYKCDGDPDLESYFPAWLNDVADDATLEGSFLGTPRASMGPYGRRRGHGQPEADVVHP